MRWIGPSRAGRSVSRDGRASKDGVRGKWSVARIAVGSDGVVVLSPRFNEHLGLLHCVEDFSIERLVSGLCCEIPSGRQISAIL